MDEMAVLAVYTGREPLECGDYTFKNGDVVCFGNMREIDGEPMVMLDLPNGGSYGYTEVTPFAPFSIFRLSECDGIH